MLLYEKAGNIGILTINRPEALNALNSALLDCLYEKVTEIAHDTELRCLIVTGAGKAFVAGADISEMKDLSRPEAFAFGMHALCGYSHCLRKGEVRAARSRSRYHSRFRRNAEIDPHG